MVLPSFTHFRKEDNNEHDSWYLILFRDNVDAVTLIMKYLREDDIVFEVRDNNGETAADIAAWYGNLQVVCHTLLPSLPLQA